MAGAPESTPRGARSSASDVDEITDAVLYASRVLVAVAARSLVGVADEVTLAQYRALVVLATDGTQSLRELALALGVHTSTATRMCDRLVRKRLVRRRQSRQDRREVVLDLTPSGRELVVDVTARRRAEIARIVARVPRSERESLVRALTAFGTAAGEVPEQSWSQVRAGQSSLGGRGYGNLAPTPPSTTSV
jgi:DNA-binding MarR family transcriptional regulator